MMANVGWRDEFLQLFLSGNPDDVAAAYALKLRSAPRVLFKFYAPSEYAFDSLCNGTVWLAAASTFNDPFDSSLTYDGTALLARFARTSEVSARDEFASLGLSGDDIASIVTGCVDDRLMEKLESAASERERPDVRRVAEAMPRIIEMMMVDELRRLQMAMQLGTKVACFTEQATSMLLWAHYASSHKGFCVEYDIEAMSPDTLQRRLLFPVFYKADRFDFAPTMLAHAAGKIFVPNHAIGAAIHKAPEWAYEREWRLVNTDGSDAVGISVPIVKPVRVHVGARMEPVDRARLEAICLQRSIAVRDVTLSPHRYEILLTTR